MFSWLLLLSDTVTSDMVAMADIMYFFKNVWGNSPNYSNGFVTTYNMAALVSILKIMVKLDFKPTCHVKH